MYGTSAGFLPNTGMGLALWAPLAAFALVFLGIALIRAARTFRNDNDDI